MSATGKRASGRRSRGKVALAPAAPDALSRLIPVVYAELRRVAHHQLRAERPGHTLRTTDLVHEAYLKLARQTQLPWADRAQFFAHAARAMRHILVDYARRHRALRRGGDRHRVSLDEASLGTVAADRAQDLIALDDALTRLTAQEERLGRVVELRFFAGLREAEVAGVLGVTPRTVARDWVKARTWLYREMRGDGG